MHSSCLVQGCSNPHQHFFHQLFLCNIIFNPFFSIIYFLNGFNQVYVSSINGSMVSATVSVGYSSDCVIDFIKLAFCWCDWVAYILFKLSFFFLKYIYFFSKYRAGIAIDILLIKKRWRMFISWCLVSLVVILVRCVT